MKIAYKDKGNRNALKLQKEYYTVLGFGEGYGDWKIYLIANDDLKVIHVDIAYFEILDDNLDDYVRMDHLNYGRTFYIFKSLSKFVADFENYSQLQAYSIWNRSKISNFFIHGNYEITKEYENTVLNIDYKVALIEGFLLFANSYLNLNNDSNYWEELQVLKSNDFDSLFHEKFKNDKEVKNIETSKYREEFTAFIRKLLFDKFENEDHLSDICSQLFTLYDAIFINDITGLCTVKTFYDECFVVEYEGIFYGLNKIWGS